VGGFFGGTGGHRNDGPCHNGAEGRSVPAARQLAYASEHC